NPFWYRLARRVVADEHLDLVIVRDLPLIFIGLHLKRRYRVPVILDMAENYPAMYREDMRGSSGLRYLAQWLLKNPTLMEHVERRTLRDVDHVLVVVQESAQRVI